MTEPDLAISNYKRGNKEMLEIGKALGACQMAQRTYGKQAEDIGALTKIYSKVLSHRSTSKIINGIRKWLLTSQVFPTPHDIENMIDSASCKKKFDPAVYKYITRLITTNPTSCTKDDYQYIEQYHKYIHDHNKAIDNRSREALKSLKLQNLDKNSQLNLLDEISNSYNARDALKHTHLSEEVQLALVYKIDDPGHASFALGYEHLSEKVQLALINKIDSWYAACALEYEHLSEKVQLALVDEIDFPVHVRNTLKYTHLSEKVKDLLKAKIKRGK